MMQLKAIFTKHLLIITVIFPLFIIFFYSTSISLTLKYKHQQYTKKELSRYEQELKEKHREFFEEKAKYIDSFMNFLYLQGAEEPSFNLTARILLFIDSFQKYDSGFIFIFKRDGTVLKHPCADRLIELVASDMKIDKNKENTILYKLLKGAEFREFVNYQGTDCIQNEFVDKIAYVHHIKSTDLYIVISKNEKDIASSIALKKKILEKKLEDDQLEVLKFLLIVSAISILFSLIFSKIINILIRDYEQEIKESHEVMFSQSRLAQAGELLSMISHQWRQPISKIASIASNLRFQIMTGEKVDTQKLDTKLYEIEDYTEFLSETIDDFREFYKPKKEKESTYILPLIEKSLGFLENELKKKRIIIEKEFDTDVKVSLYQNELIQVVVNIVQNAVEFSNEGAFIKIETILKEHEYIITITDEAGGIKEEHINKIFDAHFSTKVGKKSTNLGLGLYVSKVIIEKHFQGKLEVESQGKSSKFTIRLVRNDS